MEPVDPRIEEYAAAHTTAPDSGLARVAVVTRDCMPAPQMMSGLAESRLLEALVLISAARRVLEVGTFTGHGALSMAACLAPGGEVVTIENDESTAEIARGHIDESPYADRIRLIVGDAREEIDGIEGPFDLVFIDAWKGDYVHYYEAVLPKLSERGLIVADNVLWDGEVLDPQDDLARGLAAFNERVQGDERVHNVLITVGDGLMLIWHAPRAS
jgi:caffeoyl-CoA O-methyltransferase